MKRLFLFLIFSFTLIVTFAKSFLWQVSASHNKIYILGSIHLGKETLYPLKEEIEKAYKEAEKIVVEVDITKIDSLKMNEILKKYAFCPQNKTLKDLISPLTYKKLRRKLKEFGIKFEDVESYKPWFLATLLTNWQFMRLGFYPQYGIDVYFINKALKDNKEILEIESAEEQIEILYSLSEKEQDLFLLYTLIDLDNFEKELKQITEAWKNADAGKLVSILNSNLIHYPQFKTLYEKLIYERNRKILNKIEELLKRNKIYFVIVGVGHLIGKSGVIKELKERGYRINQL